MRFCSVFLGMGLLLLLTAPEGVKAEQPPQDAPEQWSINMTAIEACSCPMFCQCYFNTQPAGHGGHGHEGGEHFCRFTMAWKVNSGQWGDTRLDDALFWVAGDLGDDWSEGQMDWFVVHFDPEVTDEQREGILGILPHLFPVEWSSANVGRDAAIEWEANDDRAEARLDDGNLAEVVLVRYPGMTDEPIVIQNLPYWGAPRHEGFVLMPNEVHALRDAPAEKEPFEFKNSNGFMITVDMNSDDVAERG